MTRDPRRRLCELLGIEAPILLAGMAGGPTTPELVAAVSRAGGLGSFGAMGMSVDGLRAAIAAARAITDRPISVNVLLAPPTAATDPAAAERVAAGLRRELGARPGEDARPASPLELVAAGLEAGARVVSAGLGDPAPLIDLARDAGAPVIAMAATVADAVRAAESGADAIVAQGSEAGGHRSNFSVDPDGTVPLIGTMALVPQVRAAVDVPVIAAGGIMDGRGMVAALALGAAGVQLGSRFLLAAEAGVPASYQARLLESVDTTSRVTRAISGRPARGLRNRLMDEMEAVAASTAGYPAQAALTGDVRAAAAGGDRADLMALWAGQAAGLPSGVAPAGQIVADILREADEVIAALAGGRG